ncbi:MAG: major capsid protein, partial [Treponemataceae bacterium]
MEIYKKSFIEAVNNEPDMKDMGFLSSLFKTNSNSVTDAEKFSLDQIRSNNKIAPYVVDLSSGAITLAKGDFGNNEYRFPTISLDESTQINELMKRQPGENPYDKKRANWTGLLTRELLKSFVKEINMIKRSIELQAAQALQTGTVTLTDDKGNSLKQALNFGVKQSHFPSVAKTWEDITVDPIVDIDALSD